MMHMKLFSDCNKFDHSRQVSRISVLLAQKAGYSSYETSVIGQAALYHDIGKVAIPESILNKPGALTPEEFAIVKTHTEEGFSQIQEMIEILTVAAVIAREHHERLDGSGYLHLSEREIHPYARLISICDVFDALYSPRSYKPAWDIIRIRDYFDNQSRQFDRDSVALLFGAMSEILAYYKESKNA